MRLYVNIIPDLPSITYDEALEGLGDLERVGDCIGEAHIIELSQRDPHGRTNPRTLWTRSSRISRAIRPRAARATHFPRIDPAMTSAQREEVFARYKRFAAQVNARHSDRIVDEGQYLVAVDDPRRLMVLQPRDA